MQPERVSLADRAAELAHLMAAEGRPVGNFVFPSLLKEIPSVTSTHTDIEWAQKLYGELGRHSE